MRPPKHLNSALACICAVLAMCQQEVGGSQNIDHFNLVIAPFAEELKKGQYYDRDLVNHIDAFISETWRLFLTRPYEPVFSSITLEFENSPVEKCDVFKGEMKGNQYCEYWNDAREIANVLIETMYSKVEDYAYLPIYPRVFLKISINSLKNEEIISSQTLETLLSILMRSDPVNNPLYFMNMDSEMNKVPDSHVSYSSEIQRITPNGTKDDQGKGVLTFASLNLQKIIGEGAKLDEENFEKILSDIEKLVKIVVSFDAKKRTHLKDRLSGKLLPHLYLLAQPDPLTRGNTYFDVDHSSLHIGLVGLRDFFTGNIDEKDSETVEDKVKIIVVFLNQLKRMLYNLSNTYGTPIYLSQTPSRSGAYSRFFNKKDPPPEYINILPIIYEFKDFEKQLMLENKIHSVMLGGSISRIYIPIKEFPRNSEEFRDILTRAIKTGVPLFRIIPQDFKSILKEYQSKQS
jgi:anaerobic ribonucleoside-triphosphate reductase